MIHIVLFQPEIAPNTGNIGRMCAVTRCRLHLIHPLGFHITDKALRRSGMDYWQSLDVHHHDSWQDYLVSGVGAARNWLFTTKTDTTFWDVGYADEDGLLFGQETSGAPDWLHAAVGDHRVTIPRYNEEMRSLNLSTAVGIAAYEALRQLRR